MPYRLSDLDKLGRDVYALARAFSRYASTLQLEPWIRQQLAYITAIHMEVQFDRKACRTPFASGLSRGWTARCRV